MPTLKYPSIELLAPAGNWECARAAVENGADAVYFGLDVGFNARARAANFHVTELRQLMDFLHRQAVRGYVTLNTLVFTDELVCLEENVRRLGDAGVDAVLVQDLGVARLVRELCPELVVHASTQMTLTHALAIEMAQQVGVRRVVLARELSLSEIRRIREETSMPLEVFVHGALCVAYSGQCLTSESFGGRSANRGQCAQACRLPYQLLCDDQPRDLGDVKYLLSPQDLAAHDLVPQLLEAGVCSLKIEGRLKTPEYVANVCQHYRAAIDEALSGGRRVLQKDQRRELELSFSRGFSPGWLEGCDHKRLVPGLSSSKRGVELGAVEALHGETLLVDLIAPVACGDGIVIAGDRVAGTELGGRVYELHQHGKRVNRAEHGPTLIGLQRGVLREKSIALGAQVFKTDDPQLSKRLRHSFEAADPKKKVRVNLHVEAVVGKPMRMVARLAVQPLSEDTLAPGTEVVLTSQHTPEVARKHCLGLETLVQQFGRLGGTVYQLGELTADIQGSPMVPLSVLGKLRHELVQMLDAAQVTRVLPCASAGIALRMLAEVTQDVDSTSDRQPLVLRVLCRTLAQLEQVLACGVKEVIADFHDIREYRQAVDRARDNAARIELATLRIHKPGEDGLFTALHRRRADGWLVRNLAAVNYCIKHAVPFACDFSLNVTNPLTAQQLNHWGASRVTASYDMNRDQLFELAKAVPPRWLEVVIHQHMPMFHMEHCVYCSVLSPGKSKSDCGRPCDRHDVKLVDRVGAAHVLHADIGCRNTLFNATAQSGAEAVKPLVARGIHQFRVELLRDAPSDETRHLVELYRALMADELSGTAVWQQLKAQNRVGVTRGTLEQPRNPLAIL